MRQVGTLPNEQQAVRLVDYLTTLDIDVRAEEDTDEWIIWVLDEERVAEAADEYREFRSNPDGAKYLRVAGQAEARRREKTERQRAAAKNVVEMRGRWNRGTARKAPLTFLLIAACVGVFIFTHMVTPPTLGPRIDAMTGEFPQMRTPTYRALAFRDPCELTGDDSLASSFRDIRRGQVWRLVTTMLLHGDVWHILFNMYMLFYFGAQMESRKGPVRYLIFVLLAAMFASVGQVIITGPNVVGMSGVIYALFGYIWMQSRFLPKSGFYISQLTIIILVGWFFAAFTGMVGQNIGNAAHGAGLFFGIVIGYLPVVFPSLEGKI